MRPRCRVRDFGETLDSLAIVGETLLAGPPTGMERMTAQQLRLSKRMEDAMRQSLVVALGPALKQEV